MKPEAQRIKIAEACGWRAVREKDGWWNISPDGKRIAALHGSLHGFPDYLNDLNAMQSAVLSQSQQFQRRFSTHLGRRSEVDGRLPCQLTAADWAEDFLTTKREMAETKRHE